MKEVKLIVLNELVRGASWGRDLIDQKDRVVVEEGLAELLNDGWIIAGAGGEILTKAFVLLVRETS